MIKVVDGNQKNNNRSWCRYNVMSSDFGVFRKKPVYIEWISEYGIYRCIGRVLNKRHDLGDGWNPSPRACPKRLPILSLELSYAATRRGTQSHPKLCESDMMAEGIEQTFKLWNQIAKKHCSSHPLSRWFARVDQWSHCKLGTSWKLMWLKITGVR